MSCIVRHEAASWSSGSECSLILRRKFSLWCFWGEFACSTCAHVGFLQRVILKTSMFISNTELSPSVSECEWLVVLFVSMGPQVGLGTCPGCPPPLAETLGVRHLLLVTWERKPKKDNGWKEGPFWKLSEFQHLACCFAVNIFWFKRLRQGKFIFRPCKTFIRAVNLKSQIFFLSYFPHFIYFSINLQDLSKCL